MITLVFFQDLLVELTFYKYRSPKIKKNHEIKPLFIHKKKICTEYVYIRVLRVINFFKMLWSMEDIRLVYLSLQIYRAVSK